MNNSILKNILSKSKKSTLLFFIFKIFVLIFYLISNYQNFTNESIRFILNILLLTDSLLFFSAIFNIIYILSLKTSLIYKIMFMIFLIVNVMWSIINIFSISLVIAFSS